MIALLLLAPFAPPATAATAAATAAADGTPAPPLEERVEQLETGLETLRRDIGELREMLGQLLAREPTQVDATAASSAVDQRLQTLEAESLNLTQERDTLEAGLRSATERVGVLSATAARQSQVTVYGTFNIFDDSDGDARFDGEAFELVLSGQPHERLGFFAEIEYERAAAIGGARGGEVLIEQAHATYSLSTWLKLRAGVLLMPFGNFSIDHYAPARDVVSKPLVSYVVAPSDWTDNGLGILGEGPWGDHWTFDYELYAVAGLDADITALGTRAGRQPFGVDNNNNKALVGRGAWNREGWLELGLSGYHGKYDDQGRHRLTGWAVDGLFERGRLRVTGEFNRFEAERPAPEPTAVLEGWYLRLVLDITPPFFRRGWHGEDFPGARLDAVAQVDHARLNGPLEGATLSNRERRFTLGLNYRPSHNWVLKLGRERSEIEGLPLQFGEQRTWLASVGFLF